MLPPFLSPDFVVNVGYYPCEKTITTLATYKGSEKSDSYNFSLSGSTANFIDGGLIIGDFYEAPNGFDFIEFDTINTSKDYSFVRTLTLDSYEGSLHASQLLDYLYNDYLTDTKTFTDEIIGTNTYTKGSLISIIYEGQEVSELYFGTLDNDEIYANEIVLKYSYNYTHYYNIVRSYVSLIFDNVSISVTKQLSELYGSSYRYFFDDTFTYTDCCITQCCNPDTHKLKES